MTANHRTPGLAGARNSGLAEATGASSPPATTTTCGTRPSCQAQIGRLLDQPDLLVVGSGIRLMLPGGRIITWPARAERISQRLLLRNRVKELHSSTLAMRRDVFAKAGLYDEQTPNGYAEDYDCHPPRGPGRPDRGGARPRSPTSARTAAHGGRAMPR